MYRSWIRIGRIRIQLLSEYNAFWKTLLLKGLVDLFARVLFVQLCREIVLAGINQLTNWHMLFLLFTDLQIIQVLALVVGFKAKPTLTIPRGTMDPVPQVDDDPAETDHHLTYLTSTLPLTTSL